jgi:hypothetical protein
MESLGIPLRGKHGSAASNYPAANRWKVTSKRRSSWERLFFASHLSSTTLCRLLT